MATENKDISNQLSEIINRTTKQPTIVNESSNFVVVTYWWGKGNFNQNTARPCVAFYEDVIKKTTKYLLGVINTSIDFIKTKIDQNAEIDKSKVFDRIFDSYKNNRKPYTYKQIIGKTTSSYLNSIYAFCNINIKLSDQEKDEKAREILEMNKQTNKTPTNFVYKNRKEVKNILFSIIKYAILINKNEIIELYEINDQISELSKIFTENNQKQNLDELKQKIKDLELAKSKINNNMKDNLKKKQNHDESSGFSNEKYNNTNIYDILNIELRYLNPLTFEVMIEQWENACRMFNCNFLSVEYPEFAQPGGYQLAINAKPLFINKALELCGNKNILYIDGDMYIKKYPIIFDMPDVDFMARGWWMDPRSSWKMLESIMYDPYTFETSGGTMFFSQSRESKILISKWIDLSGKPYNIGKADDRILSLIFNTNKFLCNMKLIQLPIEYLWLSLDYDDRLLDELYDYDVSKMNEIICIEHPECLTSEDTAAGAGASSDRTPKFYSFIDYENLTPTSESFHEFIFFPNQEMTNSFSSYLEYMDSITYLDDGNEILRQKKLVDPLDPLENQQPLYVIKFDDKFEKRNEIVINNLALIDQIDPTTLNLINIDENTVEIQNVDNIIPEENIIPLVLKLLNQGKYVIYNPIGKNNYEQSFYDKLISKLNLYKSLDFVFNPKIDSYNFSDFFKPTIKTNLPLLFGPGNEVLSKYLSMFKSLDDLSEEVNYGAYEFISRVRIGYLFASKTKTVAESAVSENTIVGGASTVEDYINEYENGLEIMYGEGQLGGGNKSTKKHKKTYGKKKSNKKTRTRRNRRNKN